MLASDDSSSLVKNGSPEDMEVDDEIVDQVDAVIAALQKYRDKEPEVSPSNWYGYSPEPIHVDDTNTQLKENFWNSPEDEEIVSPVEEPGFVLKLGFPYSVRIHQNLMIMYKILVKKMY